MGSTILALFKQKIQRYRQLRAMLVEQGRPQREITQVDRHIARIEEILRQTGNTQSR